MIAQMHRQVLDEDNLPVGMSAVTLDQMRMDAPTTLIPVFRKARCIWCRAFVNRWNPLNVCNPCMVAEANWQRMLQGLHIEQALPDSQMRSTGDTKENTIWARAIRALGVRMRRALPAPRIKDRWRLCDEIDGELTKQDWTLGIGTG